MQRVRRHRSQTIEGRFDDLLQTWERLHPLRLLPNRSGSGPTSNAQRGIPVSNSRQDVNY
jgi:hypothetical protein